MAAREAHGDVVGFRIGFHDWILINDPKIVWDICVKRQREFLKPKIAKRLWSKFLGEGILAADGEKWTRNQKLVRPGFHRDRIEAYGTVIVNYTTMLADSWRESDSDQRDIQKDMSRLTLAIVCKTLFDADFADDENRVNRAMATLNEIMLDHIHLPLPTPRWWPSAKNRKKVAALDEIEEIVVSIIQERKAEAVDRGDLLSMLIQARDENGEGLDDKQLRDEAMTLFFAGHDTTANALTWMWLLLSRHPEVEARLLDELNHVLQGRSPTFEDLRDLPYLDMVVKESMRILPSVWVFMREPAEDVEIEGYRFPKGAFLLISPYTLGHHPDLFEDPERFEPERFSRENEAKLPSGAYVPFAAGNRMCIGKSFASMEARLVLATLLPAFHAGVPDDYEPELLAELSLHPKGGMPFRVKHRETV
jgi:cytochrome P450